MMRYGSFEEVITMRAWQAERIIFPTNTPDPALLTWRICERGGSQVGAYGYVVLPGIALYVLELLCAESGFVAKRACAEMDADMVAVAAKEGLELVATVPIGNGAMIKAAESIGWRTTHVILERGA